MNSQIEQGLKRYLINQLGAVEDTVGEGENTIDVVAFSIGELKASIHVNIAADKMPANLAHVLAGVTNVPTIVPGLYMADVTLAATTPSDVEGYNDAFHRDLSALLRACFPDLIVLRNRRAKAETPEEIAATQAALDAGNDKLAALATELDPFKLSTINAWAVTTTRDVVVEEKSRWQFTMELKLSLAD